MVERASIQVSANKLEACLIVVAANADEPLEEIDIGALIASFGIVHNLKNEAIADLSAKTSLYDFECRLVIAEGTAPVEPIAGEFDVFFETEQMPGKVFGDGRIDYTEQFAMVPAKTGEFLATYRPPIEGKSGIDVFGQKILPGKLVDPLPRLGRGVEMDDDGEVRATRSGVVVYVENKFIDVDDCVEHKGPVDMSCGNLHSGGSLVVKGDVEVGFKVEVGSALFVTGHLNSGEARAGAAMTIGGCIYGDLDSGRKVFGRDGVAAKRAQGARIESEGRVLIEKDAVDCQIRCESSQIGDGKKGGRLRGGSILALSSVIIGETGSEAGAATRVVVGCPWLLERQIRDLELQGNKSERLRVKSHVAAKGIGIGAKIVRAQSRRKGGLNELRLQLRRTSRAILKEASVEIGKAHGGTTLVFGKFEYRILETKVAKRFRFDTTARHVVEEDLR